MEQHEFFQKYANMPLDKRMQVIDMVKYGDMNFADVYAMVKSKFESMGRLEVEIKDLIKIAEPQL